MQSEHAAPEASALPRHIGWFTAGCVLVSNVVGSGIFGFVANFAQEVMQGQLPLSMEGIRQLGSRIIRPQ